MITRLQFLLALAGILVMASVASADQKSHRKAAEDLLLAMNVDQQLQTAIDQLLNLQTKADPQLAPYKDVLKKFFTKHMSWEKLKDEMITIYTDAFTEEELVEITKFIRSPVGKKMVEKTPELMKKGMEMGANRVQANQAELLRMLEEARDK